MKLLLTSNGLSNSSIANALEALVGKPRKKTKIAFIPSSGLGPGEFKQESREWLVNDMNRAKDFSGFIDIVSLSDLNKGEILERLEFADIIFMGGGNAFYLSYLLHKAGLFDELPRLIEPRVYVGISAGSMVATASMRTASKAIEHPEKFYDAEYDELGPPERSAGRSAKLVNFVVRPHYNREDYPNIRDDILQSIVQDVQLPLYAIDDESAVLVDGDKIEVVSEGTWKLYEPKK